VRTIAIALFTLAGCIDEFQGSNIQIDFKASTPVQASAYGLALADELPHNIHFTLYAMDETIDSTGNTVGYLFAIQTFEIHRVVDLASPCYIDAGPRVPIPGVHISQFAAAMGELKGIEDIANPPASASEEDLIDVATAMQRQKNVALLAGHEGPKAITSASPRVYGTVAAACDDTNGIPPPHCYDAASNQRRLERCRAAWAADEQMFEGTDRILTQPLSGSVAGFVLGEHPVNLAPIGGAGFFVDEVLDRFEGYALYWQYDDADNDGQPDYPPSVPQSERSKLGELYLFGRPEINITRGVIHVQMSSFVHTEVEADLVIFAAIGDDDVHF
jgi:hypothetical protein